MRAARIACTVGGIFSSPSDLVSFIVAVAHQRAFIEQHLHRLFHEKRVALGLFYDQSFQRSSSLPSPSSADSISSALSLPSGSSRSCV